MSIQEIIESVQTLSHGDQQHLRKLLDEMLLQQKEVTKIEAFHQALLAAGLIKAINTPNPTRTTERQLIHVKGKPLSETIIEDRR